MHATSSPRRRQRSYIMGCAPRYYTDYGDDADDDVGGGGGGGGGRVHHTLRVT